MLGPARRGFRARFERIVDPEGLLDPVEREVRVDRLLRAYMLEMAARSAVARRSRRHSSMREFAPSPDEESGRSGPAVKRP
jgi:hypothetical protein